MGGDWYKACLKAEAERDEVSKALLVALARIADLEAQLEAAKAPPAPVPVYVSKPKHKKGE